MRSIMNAAGRAMGVAACATALAGAAGAESLPDAWRMALASDAGIAAARAERSAADDDRRAAERSRWPVVDASAGYTRLQEAPMLDIPVPGGRFQSPRIWRNDQYVNASTDLSVPVFTSGRLSGTIGAARAGASGAAALESRSVAEVKLAVAEAYVDVLRARHARAVAESGVASLEAHAQDVRVMYEREAVPRADLLAVEVALANARQQQLRARHALRIATAAYNRRVGQPLDREPDLETPRVVPAAPAESLDALTAAAVEARPELAALMAKRDALAQSARAERAGALPQLTLRAGYTHLDNQILDRQNFASVGVQLQWRLFDGGQLRARTAALAGRARAADRQLEELRSLVALEVESEYLSRQDADARAAAGRTAVEQADENLRMARELYGAGLATNTQVLDAESLRVIAVRNRDDAELDRVLAAYRLDRAIGRL